jgi:coronin-7
VSSSLSPLCTDRGVHRILFLWSKGSRQILAYHLNNTELIPLPTFDAPDLQTAVSFLPKKLVDVRTVEINQALRFTSGNKIERIGFFIPRGKMEFFQDDVFVETVDTECSVLSVGEFWEGRGKMVELPVINLRPRDMIPRTLLSSPPRCNPILPPSRQNFFRWSWGC